MAFILMLVSVAVIIALQVPTITIKRLILKHNRETPKILITARQLVLHLLKIHKIQGVEVIESKNEENYYNYKKKQICLSKDIIDKKSVSALSIAAHEFGHVQQHAEFNYKFLLSVALSRLAALFRIISFIVILSSIVAVVLLGSRYFVFIVFFAYVAPGIFNLLLSILAAPIEFEASFIYAYPILKEGKHLTNEDLSKTKIILTAAAFTYIARSIADVFSLFNFFSRRRILFAGI